MNVYLVEEYYYEGSYVCGVFSTRELAQAFIDSKPRKHRNSYEITEVTLDQER